MEEKKRENSPAGEAEKSPRHPHLIAAVKFIPLLVFATLVIFFKLDLLIAGPLATFAALAVYMILYREKDFEKAFEHGLAATRKIALIFFILMFAYGVAECFMATGVGASLILIALRLGITAACAPIFLWLNHLVGGDVLLTLCAIAGGSCFGDNIGMISDVTVLSCGMQDVKIIDRIKHQMAWCFGCLALALVVFYFAAADLPNVQGDVGAALDSIPAEAYEALTERRPSAVLLLDQVKTGVPYYMVVPMLLVIVLSFLGLHTLICLGVGMFSSLVLGYIAGTANLHIWLNDLLYGGFSGAGEWVIVMMMWVSAFGGIMNAMNAFEPLSRLVVHISRTVHGLMGWCGVLCLMGNMALADEAAQVATLSPIVRDIVEKNVETESEEDAYRLRLRLAAFTSSMGIYGSQLIPWHCFPVFFAGIATAVYPIRYFSPMDIIGKNYFGSYTNTRVACRGGRSTRNLV